MLYNNVIEKVIRKELETLSYEETTYNFEAEDNHNYYVENDKILVILENFIIFLEVKNYEKNR